MRIIVIHNRGLLLTDCVISRVVIPPQPVFPIPWWIKLVDRWANNANEHQSWHCCQFQAISFGVGYSVHGTESAFTFCCTDRDCSNSMLKRKQQIITTSVTFCSVQLEATNAFSEIKHKPIRQLHNLWFSKVCNHVILWRPDAGIQQGNLFQEFGILQLQSIMLIVMLFIIFNFIVSLL